MGRNTCSHSLDSPLCDVQAAYTYRTHKCQGVCWQVASQTAQKSQASPYCHCLWALALDYFSEQADQHWNFGWHNFVEFGPYTRVFNSCWPFGYLKFACLSWCRKTEVSWHSWVPQLSLFLPLRQMLGKGLSSDLSLWSLGHFDVYMQCVGLTNCA